MSRPVVRRLPLSLGSLACALAIVAAPVAAQSPSPADSCPPVRQVASAAPIGVVEQPDLTVFAAASLTDAFEALREPWQAAHPGSELMLSFDASSMLRTQIEEGAPADVFAAADARDAQALVDDCLAPRSVTPFAGNTFVVVVPIDNPAGIQSPADLARRGVRVVAAAPAVPVSRYTTEVIENLGVLPGYPSDFAAAVAANTVSEEDNVRAVLAKIELGEGDAAIAYVTDAISSDHVAQLAIPDEANVSAAYAAVAIADSEEPAMAAAFLAFLVGPEAQAILAGHGFLPVIEASSSPG